MQSCLYLKIRACAACIICMDGIAIRSRMQGLGLSDG